VGLYSDGQILLGSHWSQASFSRFEAGSTVGVLVYLLSDSDNENNCEGFDCEDGENRVERKEGEFVREGENGSGNQREVVVNSFPSTNVFKFNLNGAAVSCSSSPASSSQFTIHNIIPVNTPLYPTVSLFSENTRVVSYRSLLLHFIFLN
jgi:hypothetical protein